MGSSGPDLGTGLLGGGPLDAGVLDGGVGLLGGGETFAPPRFGMGDILAGNGAVPPSPHGNDPWSAWAAWLGIPPDALRRLDAALAASPGGVAQNGAWPSDRGATPAPEPTQGFAPPAAATPPRFDDNMFAPRLPDPSHYLAAPRAPLPTWDTVAPPWPPHQQPMMEGRETGPSDLVRMLTGFAQPGIPTNFSNDNQGGAEPQWWPRGTPSFQSPDALTDVQPISAPVPPEQRDFKGWWPTQQSTNEGRETGPSGSGWWAPDLETNDPLIPAAFKRPRKQQKREPEPPRPDQRGGLPIDLLEEEARGGHGWAEHVHRNAAALTRQIRDKFVERPWLRDVREGSFLSDMAGNKLTNSTLAQNKTIVDQVAAGKLRDATVYTQFRSPTGFEARAAHRGAGVHVDVTYGVSVHIVHDPESPTGYTVWSYYPSNGKD